MLYHKLRPIGLFLLLCTPVLSYSADMTPTPKWAFDQIESQLERHVKTHAAKAGFKNIDYKARLPDKRLKLEYCPTPLHIDKRSRRRNVGRMTFQVSCSNIAKPWRVYVSVELKAFKEIVVTASPIPKGSQITANMLVLALRDITNEHRGYYDSINRVVGSSARFGIAGNKVLRPGNILPPKLITKGEKVIINAEMSGIKINTYGLALSHGALGELIRVRNLSSNKIVEGRVVGAGKIAVGL